MSTVKLKNGTEELEPAVAAVSMSLNSLFERSATDIAAYLALYGLAKKSTDWTYDVSYSAETLKRLGLIDERGGVHETIRNVVASALEVDDNTQTIKLSSPCAPK